MDGGAEYPCCVRRKIDTSYGAGKLTGDGGAEYPCVRRLRHRRLITFLWQQGLEAPTKLITRGTFFSVPDLRLLVERGQWSDAIDHLSRFLPPHESLSLSVEAAALHRFLSVHRALADIVAGVSLSEQKVWLRPSQHVAAFFREYMIFIRDDRVVCNGAMSWLRSLLRSTIVAISRHKRHLGRPIDWERVQRRAAELVENLAYRTPELRDVALLPGGPLDPHNVLPICCRRSSHVKKKQACDGRPQASAVALAKLYLRKRSSLPSLSQESPDELLTKTLDKVSFYLDESLKAGSSIAVKHQENPLQRIGKEGSSCNPISQITFGTSTDHASNSVASSLTGKGITKHLDQEVSNAESGFNPKKNHPREELTTSDEQDPHPKRQRTTGAFGKMPKSA